MHTFKPGMPVKINEGCYPLGYYSSLDFANWKNNNKSFKVS